MKRFLELVRYAAAIIGFGSFFFGLGYSVKSLQQPPEVRTVARKLDVASCKVADNDPAFLRDSAIILKEDMGQKQSQVFMVESNELERYNPFVWTIELWPEFSSYNLEVRSAFLRRSGKPVDFYQPLRWQKTTQQFPIHVLPSEPKDRILVLLGISADREIAITDCKRLFKTTVGLATQ